MPAPAHGSGWRVHHLRRHKQIQPVIVVVVVQGFPRRFQLRGVITEKEHNHMISKKFSWKHSVELAVVIRIIYTEAEVRKFDTHSAYIHANAE